jgi:hypothetical protein
MRGRIERVFAPNRSVDRFFPMAGMEQANRNFQIPVSANSVEKLLLNLKTGP